jgi:DNA-binding cell septation regulator SpoVG
MHELNNSLVAAQRLCRVDQVIFKPADHASAQRGVVWRCQFHLDGKYGVRADIRRCRADDRLYLAFPRERSRNGRSHSSVWPVTLEIHAAIELQVFESMRQLGALVDPARLPTA